MAVQVLDLNLNCRECDDTLKRERGCTHKGILPFYLSGEQHFRCPLKLVTPTSWEYIRAYGFYKDSFLPNGKGWTGESDKFLDAMIVIGNEVAKTEREKAESARRKSRK